MNQQRTIIFAGGGTGGHIFPALAIAERLAEREGAPNVRFICSDRPLDRQILTTADAAFEPLSVKPLPSRPLPGRVAAFVRHYWRSKQHAARILREHHAALVVSMGGFVSGPVVAAARSARVPVMLVNLDAEPGKANRWLARRCTQIYTVYETRRLPEARTAVVPMPLRRSCLGPDDRAEARRQLDLDPDQPLLLVTGASQGAESINRMMTELINRPAFRSAIEGWRILHLAGHERADDVRAAYEESGVAATVQPFCDRMGMAWSAAEIAISRAGAGSVAEVIANCVPTVFLPYPYHRDQHQKLNAAPAVGCHGALMLDDLIEASSNADQMFQPLVGLMRDSARRQQMRQALRTLHRGDGATILADAAMQMIRTQS